jgi:hypothetical protein
MRIPQRSYSGHLNRNRSTTTRASSNKTANQLILNLLEASTQPSRDEGNLRLYMLSVPRKYARSRLGWTCPSLWGFGGGSCVPSMSVFFNWKASYVSERRYKSQRCPKEVGVSLVTVARRKTRPSFTAPAENCLPAFLLMIGYNRCNHGHIVRQFCLEKVKRGERHYLNASGGGRQDP